MKDGEVWTKPKAPLESCRGGEWEIGGEGGDREREGEVYSVSTLPI